MSVLSPTMSVQLAPAESFAEILPRFISNLISHIPHKRVFSDRDPLLYWLYDLYKAGAATSLGFITPRSAVRSRPPLPNLCTCRSEDDGVVAQTNSRVRVLQSFTTPTCQVLCHLSALLTQI